MRRGIMRGRRQKKRRSGGGVQMMDDAGRRVREMIFISVRASGSSRSLPNASDDDKGRFHWSHEKARKMAGLFAVWRRNFREARTPPRSTLTR
jgi:hypothetical protein